VSFRLPRRVSRRVDQRSAAKEQEAKSSFPNTAELGGKYWFQMAPAADSASHTMLSRRSTRDCGVAWPIREWIKTGILKGEVAEVV
jgi:hypothetical protein